MADGKMKSESYQLGGGINSKVSQYVNGPMEFRDISNMNFVTPGALSSRPGTTLYSGATVAGQITGGYEFQRLSGASYIIATANTNAYTVTQSGFNAFNTNLTNGALFSFVTFVDRLFACNGSQFFKWDGSTVEKVGLPAGSDGWGVTYTTGGGLTGTFVASWGYINDRGFIGPPAQGITITVGLTGSAILYYGLTSPAGFGITAIQLYRTTPGGVTPTGTTTSPYLSSTATDIGFTLTSFVATNDFYMTLIPSYLEIFNNQLFMAGFSAFPSSVKWSEIGEPEGTQPSFDAEFRTNDGDVITAMKYYNGALIVTKNRSFHRITGDNPSNFSLQQISDQYGCLSSRAIVTFNNLLWFLDTKGIVEYDSANVSIVSNPVEPIFKSMNISAAQSNACAVHARDFNEVWFAIPVNGSTLNNMIVVHDYLSNAWTHYDGVNIANLFIARGALARKLPFFGGYAGGLFNFSPTLMGDSGRGITCMFDSAWLQATGRTTENQYRRFYLDVNPVLGVTQPITMNFRSNFGTTVQLTRTMYQNPYQSRVDFGISSRSIQAEMQWSSASLQLVVNGFTFESRVQREV